MTQKTFKKPLIYTEINDLLQEHGESILVAAQNPLFRQRVMKEILELFAPENVSTFTLESTRAILESYEKGAIDLQDIYLLRDFVVQLQYQAIEKEGNLSLYEVINLILQSGNVGESVANASKKLLAEGKVTKSAVESYQ